MRIEIKIKIKIRIRIRIRIRIKIKDKAKDENLDQDQDQINNEDQDQKDQSDLLRLSTAPLSRILIGRRLVDMAENICLLIAENICLIMAENICLITAPNLVDNLCKSPSISIIHCNFALFRPKTHGLKFMHQTHINVQPTCELIKF